MAGLLSMKEALELAVLRDVMEKRLTLEEACERLKIERTTLWRRRKRFSESGAKGLAHKLRGRAGNRRADKKVWDAVCKLYSNEYQAHGFNVTHFYEQAHKNFPKPVSYSAVWRWLRAENLVAPRRRGRSTQKFRAAIHGRVVQAHWVRAHNDHRRRKERPDKVDGAALRQGCDRGRTGFIEQLAQRFLDIEGRFALARLGK